MGKCAMGRHQAGRKVNLQRLAYELGADTVGLPLARWADLSNNVRARAGVGHLDRDTLASALRLVYRRSATFLRKALSPWLKRDR